MYAKIICSIVVLFCFVNGNAQELQRYSNNVPLPKLNVLGIAMSESLEAGNMMINDVIKGQMEMPVDYPVYIDPTYKQLKESSGFDISLFGKSASGKKFESNVDTELELNANTFTWIVTDRKMNVRAFSQVMNFEPENFAKLVEELLLNLDGEELITIDSEEPGEASGWQTSLGKKNYDKEKDGALIIDFGAGDMKWYKYICKEIPDIEFVSQGGQKATLHNLIKGKVSLIAVFQASGDSNNMLVMPGLAMQLSNFYQYYYSFALGKADLGNENEDRAKLE